MTDNTDEHAELVETVTRSVCGKSSNISTEECVNGSAKSICKLENKCKIFEKTNDQLKYIISSLDENIFLSACPGSGKTEVIGVKAAFEVNRWKSKHSGIAFLTFTNNATSVIKDRVMQFVGGVNIGYPYYIGTIDSWLHRYIAHPFANMYTKYVGDNGDSSIRIIENSSKAGFLNNFQTQYGINGLGKISANQFFFDLMNKRICFWSGNQKTDNVRNSWQLVDWQRKELIKTKKIFLRSGFATYQDIEFVCSKLLENQSLQELVSKRFPNIVIDECQDLSTTQLLLLQQLMNGNCKVHFIGDLNQSIYDFKGVIPEEINKFIKNNNFAVQNLDENFRSFQPITDLCNKLVNIENVKGVSYQDTDPICYYFIYDDEAELADLPKKFTQILAEINFDINLEKVAILARGHSLIGKIRSYSNPSIENESFYPALAISTWNLSARSFEQTNECISLMGKFLTNKLFSSKSSNAKRFYCPEDVLSPIHWRIFVASVLSGCCKNDGLINFQNDWSNWAKSFRENIKAIISEEAKRFNTIDITDDMLSEFRYSCPKNYSQKIVVDTEGIMTNSSNNNIRVTTFHKIKGETLDAVMVVSSPTNRGGGHWKKWLEDPTNENARFAYVASSRPKKLLVWAIPKRGLDDDGKKELKNLGFTEIIIKS